VGAREYPNRPIVGVGAVVLHEGRVVLTRRGREPNRGLWTLPGGAVEAGEGLREAVTREVLEETGLAAEAGPVVEVLERITRDETGRVRYHYVLVDFVCRLVPGTPADIVCGDDCPEARWVAPGALDGLPLTEGTREVVERALAADRGDPAPADLFVGDPYVPPGGGRAGPRA
jgi:8-oxo-dGTP diphosphatase